MNQILGTRFWGKGCLEMCLDEDLIRTKNFDGEVTPNVFLQDFVAINEMNATFAESLSSIANGVRLA